METNLKPHITLDNQAESYNDFLELLMASNTLQSVNHLRCNPVKQYTGQEQGNKLKPYRISYDPFDGTYKAMHKNNIFEVQFQRGQAKITGPCKSIQYLKRVTIYGATIELVKQYIKYIFSWARKNIDQSLISVYENRSTYWALSKYKKPRKIESVILEKTIIKDILADIRQFIDSQQWYTQMGIPYKRSYLLYGPPGTGKSSLAQAIAGQIKYSICYLNCSVKEINDSTLNQLLNSSPKKSIILLEDVDSIFSERKNSEKNNILTFSGFLNALDGVRSQQGRIILMTTNYKDRLDPALLRPGRTDKSYKIGLASKYQMQKMCLRFYQNQKLAKSFAQKAPEGKFSMSLIQCFLLKYRKNPEQILVKMEQELLNNEENVTIDEFLFEINCQDCSNGFKLQQCHTLAQAKKLTKTQIERITMKLSRLQVSRVSELIHADRTTYIKSSEQLDKYIDEVAKNDTLRKQLKTQCKKLGFKTFFQVKDKLNEITAK